MRLLVCGGAGFIGSNFVRLRLREGRDEVVVLDKLTYAGRRENLQDVESDPRFTFVHGAIEDPAAVAAAIDGVEAVVNFAAETHVDRSILDPDAFVRTHALGTFVLLEAARERGVRFVQISTDEVYGSIAEGSFTEASPLDPSSPYSATKAGADLLVSSYRHTYGTETLICRGSNNYGPYQYPEKLIPLMVLNALAGRLEQHEGTERVGAHEGVRLEDRAVDVRLGGEVDDRLGALDRRRDGGRVLDRAVHERESRVGFDILEVLATPGVGQLVEHDNFVVVVAQPQADEVGADEAGATTDQQPHRAKTSGAAAQ